MDDKKVIYYNDELNDEFSTAKIIPRKIDENYKYSRSNVWEVVSYIIQNIISMPIKVIYAKAKFKLKIVGKEKFSECKNSGCFIYANHTQISADTFIPSLAIYPKRNFFIVNPENISMKPFGGLIEMLGAIPVPGNKTAARNFLNKIRERVKSGNSITIYPEAHIWPYYTKIRPFKAVSFKYPVETNKPVFCITYTYQSYGKNKKCQIVSYIDGPFYADSNLPINQSKQELRDRVYNKMVERSNNSNIEIVKYVKRQEISVG